MKIHSCHFSSYKAAIDEIPISDLLKNKDKRADSPARVAVLAAAQALKEIDDIVELSALNIIIVNREGCVGHIQKVHAGIINHQPAQGFFVRGGPQTLATYTALALGSHGATFTFVGDQQVLVDAVSMALHLTRMIGSCETLLIAIVKHEIGYQANTALIHDLSATTKLSDANLEQEIHTHLALAFSQEQ